MPQNAGQYNRRVTIQQKAAGVDSWGQPVITWTNVLSVWAWVKTNTGIGLLRAEGLYGGTEVSRAAYSIRIRYRAGITSGMRVMDGTVIYDIKQVLPDLEGQEYIDLVCVTGASEG